MQNTIDKNQDASLSRTKRRSSVRRTFFEVLTIVIAVLAAIAMILMMLTSTFNAVFVTIAGIIFTLSLIIFVRLLMNPDTVRAHQSDLLLQLSSATLDLMKEGMTSTAAQGVCELLLPNSAAIAVAITDQELILGYAGYLAAENPSGTPIRTQATHEAIADGQVRVLRTCEEIGFPQEDSTIKAAIIVPLWVGNNVEGTLKFYYKSPSKITETQKSIAEGFGELLATQMAATEMETQRKLATSMELKMLQSQINPHFLFNTINTIASLIRTDPSKARSLLRDFATFYRRTLEDSSERIMLSREIEQTMRYFSFEVARFGEDRVALCLGVASEVQDMMVPPFLIQPLVENAVKHAMPSEGKLTVTIVAEVDGDDVLVMVIDDGVGMSEETCNNIMHPTSSTGMGIAVKNVHDRMKGYFGSDAEMKVESVLGDGTAVTLRLPGCAVRDASEDIAQVSADSPEDAESLKDAQVELLVE